MAKYLIVGFRVWMPTRLQNELAPFIGTAQPDFERDCLSGTYPVGTLARLGERWFEVDIIGSGKSERRVPVEIEPPEPGQYLQRVWRVIVSTVDTHQPDQARQLALF
jgi:hypothetical protein